MGENKTRKQQRTLVVASVFGAAAVLWGASTCRQKVQTPEAAAEAYRPSAAAPHQRSQRGLHVVLC